MTLESVFVINPSSYISGLCYSIFRLEPFSTCTFSCLYCYARWYRREAANLKPQLSVVRAWRKLAKKLSKIDLKPYFRLSTLSDPLQEAELACLASLEMLRIAYKYEIPIILNTKSTYILKSPWLDLILSIADRGLILVQISIAFSDEVSKILEPRASPSTARLEAIEALREHDVPVVARIQPLIPGLEDEHLWAARSALDHGALGLIGESIRETRKGLENLSKLLGFDLLSTTKWESYQLRDVPGMEGLLHPTLSWRIKIHEELYALAKSFGRVYSTCKEGIVFEWKPGMDCCLAWLGVKQPYAQRITLYELKYLKVTDIEDACARLQRGNYICYKTSIGYPRIVRRGLKMHEARLRRLAGKREAIEKLLPVFYTL